MLLMDLGVTIGQPVVELAQMVSPNAPTHTTIGPCNKDKDEVPADVYYRGLSGDDWTELNGPYRRISSIAARFGYPYDQAVAIIANPVTLARAVIEHSLEEHRTTPKIFVGATKKQSVAKYFATRGPDPSGIVVRIRTARKAIKSDVVASEHEWLFFWSIGDQGEEIQVVW